MKKLTYLLIALGGMLILLSALFRELDMGGARELKISGIVVLMISMILFAAGVLQKKTP